MKKSISIFIVLLIFSTKLIAQLPGLPGLANWKVNEPLYQYNMTIVAKLNMDGTQLINQLDLVGAFVGGTCRGVSGLIYVASAKSFYAYLTVFSNTPGEAITFYLYNSANLKTSKVSKTINFLPNQHLGDLFQSYSIAEPTLNNKADILSFDFLNIKTTSSAISTGLVNLSISESNSLANLTPVFTLSKGATLLKSRLAQSSGSTAYSFTAPVVYEVLSEDESTLSNYTVNVSKSSDPIMFYKKDEVCSKLGAIKVVSTREGNTVQLSLNGNPIASKQILNGEAVFLNLKSGTYVATIGAENKIIVVKSL
jgi:hypothetical protein